MYLDKILSKLALFFIWIYQKTISSHKWIFRDILYDRPVCTHEPHCSEYSKEVFQKYGFRNWLKYTMERVDKCVPDTSITYDPSSYKIVYFCSAAIWIPFLSELAQDPKFEISWLVTWADKTQWRWQKMKQNIVKKYALENLNMSLDKIQSPSRLRWNSDFLSWLKNIDADFLVVLSYWKILSKDVLDLSRIWPINIHWSILPKYRGASPIQSVFLNQELETWITAIFMDETMDTGDIISSLPISLDKKDNSKTLIEKFQKLWPKRFANALRDFWKWKLSRKKQDPKLATYCTKFNKSDAIVDFQESAKTIYSKFQAFYLRPKIYTSFKWKNLQIIDCFWEDKNSDFWVWEFFEEYWLLKIKTWDWNLIVYELKFEWKKTISWKDFINSYL